MNNKLKKKTNNILIVDDHFIVLKGMEIFLAKFYNFYLFKAKDYDEALNVLNILKIDLVILDLNINGKVDFEVIKKIKILQPDTLVLVYSAFDEIFYSNEALIYGANGYLTKFSEEKEVKFAIDQILVKGTYFKNNFKNKIVINSRIKNNVNVLSCLSKREIDVANLIVKGVKLKEVSNILNLKMTTVSTYKKRIFEKFKIDNVISLSRIMKDGSTIR